MAYQPTTAAVAPTSQNVTANATAAAWNSLVFVDATAGPVTVTLPTAVGALDRKITVIKTDASTNAVTVVPNGAQTINGGASIAFSGEREAAECISDGANVYSSGADFENRLGAIRSIAADYSATGDDETILVDASAGNVNVTLPSIAAVSQAAHAKWFTIKLVNQSAANACSITGSGAGTVETVNSSPSAYAASTSWSLAGVSYTLVADATNNRWMLI